MRTLRAGGYVGIGRSVRVMKRARNVIAVNGSRVVRLVPRTGDREDVADTLHSARGQFVRPSEV